LSKQELDVDAVIALANDRFNVMAKFGAKVVSPLVRAQYQANLANQSRRLLRRAKSVICRNEQALSASEQRRLEEIKKLFPTLETVYSLRVRLWEVWSKRTGNKADIYDALREWCQQAETKLRELGHVQELQSFINELKYYATPQPSST
jgi:hypothetical protein